MKTSLQQRWLAAPVFLMLALCGHSAYAQQASPCTETTRVVSIQCPYQTLDVSDGTRQRSVRYQVPTGPMPAAGWKVAMLFQGTGGVISWAGVPGSNGGSYGYYYQVQLLKALLDAGYAVVAPPGNASGTAWQTNMPSACPKGKCTENYGPTVDQYKATVDYQFFVTLFDTMARSAAASPGAAASGFGVKFNSSQMYAAGISGGGYNSSRMAVNFPSTFRALAIQSASYANCSGAYCKTMPVNADSHPPTLFLHGAGDTVVPVTTMFPYDDILHARSKSYLVVDYTPGSKTTGDARCNKSSQANCAIGHQWIAAAPVEILNWFASHP